VIWLGARMRDDDGRKLDHKTLEQLRIRAVRQVEQGTHPEDVAAALGMTRAAVYGWLAKYREGGLEALKARPVPGRPPRLSGAQLQRLYTLVVGNDPRPVAVRVRVVDPRHGPRAHSPGIRCGAVGGQRGAAAAQARAVAAAAPVPRLPAEPRGGGALEGRDLPPAPRGGRRGGGHDPLR